MFLKRRVFIFFTRNFVTMFTVSPYICDPVFTDPLALCDPVYYDPIPLCDLVFIVIPTSLTPL